VFKNILIIKPSSLGDVIHGIPVLAKLRATYPDARISWLVGTAAAPLIESNPNLNRVFYFGRRPGGLVRSLRVHLALLNELRAAAFDCVIDLQGLLRSAFLAWATRAPRRIGFLEAREKASVFYTDKVSWNGLQHAVDQCLSVGQVLGFDTANPAFALNVPAGAQRSVERILSPLPRPYIVLSPGTRWASKCWPAANFADAAGRLCKRVGGTYFVTGTKDEADATAAAIVDAVGAQAVNLVGRTSLTETVALISKADMLVTPDSGPMHMADALGTPLVAVFGPTDSEHTGPYFQRKRVIRAEGACDKVPCRARNCSNPKCMSSISGETVADRVVAVLEGRA